MTKTVKYSSSKSVREGLNLENCISVKEMASSIGVHQNTIRNMIRNGRINAFRISDKERSHWRIPKSEVNRMGEFHLNSLIDIAVEKRLKIVNSI